MPAGKAKFLKLFFTFRKRPSTDFFLRILQEYTKHIFYRQKHLRAAVFGYFCNLQAMIGVVWKPMQ